MKKFDLEKAKAGAPLVTRDGKPVQFVAHVPNAKEHTRVITVSNKGELCASCDTGAYWSDERSGYDLFMAPVKRTVYVNIYNDGSAKHYNNPQMATMYASTAALAVAVPVEVEE